MKEKNKKVKIAGEKCKITYIDPHDDIHKLVKEIKDYYSAYINLKKKSEIIRSMGISARKPNFPEGIFSSISL